MNIMMNPRMVMKPEKTRPIEGKALKAMNMWGGAVRVAFAVKKARGRIRNARLKRKA